MVGAVLNGMIASLTNVNILSREDAASFAENINSSDWYPLKRCFDVFRYLERTYHDIGAILYRAGMNFIEDWYRNGPGGALVQSGIGFLEFQTGATGYASVVRGDRERVGWTRLLRLDTERQVGLVESVTPFPREFERGVWTAGMLTPGDMDWVDVDIEEQRLGPLYRRLVSVWYRRKPDPSLQESLDTVVSSRDSLASASPALTDALLWKYRSLMAAYERDRQFWQASQHLFSAALDRLADLTSDLACLANTDPLTGLFNRRKMVELGNIEANLLARLQLPLSVLMVDIDHFKQINDSCGHHVGDNVIKAVAELLRTGLRSTDHVGRVGDEEFLLLLPNTPESDAYALAESLRKAVAAMEVLSDGKRVEVSISLGCATTTNSLPFEQLVARADVALYKSKSSGRNKTTKSFSETSRAKATGLAST